MVVESDTLFVGRPNAIAVDGRGRVFVSDAAERKVTRVDRDGTGLRIVARRGNGPGEVSSPSSVAILGDERLLIKNAAQRRIDVFDVRQLQFRGYWGADFPVTTMTGTRAGVVMGSVSPSDGTAWVALTDSLSPGQRGGSIPLVYQRTPVLAQAFGAIEVGADSATVMGVFEASNTIYRWDRTTGSIIDSLDLPVTRRRGARPDVLETLVRDPGRAAELAFQWSFPLYVAPLSNERVAVVHYDPTMQGNVYAGPSYLSVGSWRSRQRCADIELPVPADVPPRYTSQGDTLIAVVQHPDSLRGASTWIVRWMIPNTICP